MEFQVFQLNHIKVLKFIQENDNQLRVLVFVSDNEKISHVSTFFGCLQEEEDSDDEGL